jgi:uncharacterized repeat protein (TIGR01451 family)
MRLLAATAMAASAFVVVGAAAALGADLKVSKTASADTVNQGSNVTYTIRVENLGPEAATGVTVRDELNKALRFVSASSSLGQCSAAGATVSCAIGSLAAGVTPVTVTLLAKAEKTGTVRNTASVTADQADAVSSNNEASVSVRVVNPRAAKQPQATCRGLRASLVGTAGPDTLTGTPGRDVIAAFGGNDLIRGLSGRDLVCAGRGSDVVNAGTAEDRVFGGPGKDRLRGAGGPDLLAGGSGNDILRGNRGNDRLRGGLGTDLCRGGAGIDFFRSCER